MTRRIEVHKHGPFDRRYGSIRLEHPPPSLTCLGAVELDWHDFQVRFFPDGRRHDSDALAAYESYRTNSSPLTVTAKQGGPEEMPGTASPAVMLVRESESGAGLERSVH